MSLPYILDSYAFCSCSLFFGWSLWNENTKIANDINVGDRIVVKDGYVSEYARGDDRELQISLRKGSDVEVISGAR